MLTRNSLSATSARQAVRRGRGKAAAGACSFCGQPGRDRLRLVAGPGVCICTQCVEKVKTGGRVLKPHTADRTGSSGGCLNDQDRGVSVADLKTTRRRQAG